MVDPDDRLDDDEIDEDALSFGYIREDQAHRLRAWDDGHTVYLEQLPAGLREPGSGPEFRRGRPPWVKNVLARGKPSG